MNFFTSSLLVSFALLAASAAAETRLIAGYGGRCNPTTPVGPDCATGLACWVEPRNPPLLGASGYCTRLVGLGSRCKGAVRAPYQCAEGLTCFKRSAALGSFGECRTLAKAGERCGGSVRYPAVCEGTLNCMQPKMIGAFGTCV